MHSRLGEKTRKLETNIIWIRMQNKNEEHAQLFKQTKTQIKKEQHIKRPWCSSKLEMRIHLLQCLLSNITLI